MSLAPAMTVSRGTWLTTGVCLTLAACGRTQIYEPRFDPLAECIVGQTAVCETGRPGVCAQGIAVCSLVNGAAKAGACMAVTNPSAEICDELDNDCDGDVDEGLRCPHAPIVTCGASQSVDANTVARLTASAADIDGEPVSCKWTIVSRPTTSSAKFTDPTDCEGTYYPADIVGEHRVRFTATDTTGRSTSCEITLTVRPVGDLWMELTWDKENDVDAHVQHPNAGDPLESSSWAQSAGADDCYWNNKTPEWDAPGTDDNPSLDRDDEYLTGPENIRINSPVVNQSYRIGVHMFKSRGGFPVNATVRIYCAKQLITELKRGLGSVGEMWFVGTVVNHGESCAFMPDGRTLYVEPVD